MVGHIYTLMKMGILIENLDIKLDKLNTRYIWSRGTEFRLNNQTIADLRKRYHIVPEVETAMDMADLYLNTRNKIRPQIRAVFEIMTVDDVVPSDIVGVLNKLGINCDAVVMTSGMDGCGAIGSVSFSLYRKKTGGRERYVSMGYIELVIQSTARHRGDMDIFNIHQRFWEKMICMWRSGNNARLSSIFHRKVRCKQLRDKFGMSNRIVYQYVAAK